MQDYLVNQRDELQNSVDAAARAGKPVDSPHLVTWGNLAGAIESYSLESYASFSSDSQYARGTSLSSQLDTFRSYLVSISAPNIPPVTPPPPVKPAPGLLDEGMSILELVALVMILRELK